MSSTSFLNDKVIRFASVTQSEKEARKDMRVLRKELSDLHQERLMLENEINTNMANSNLEEINIPERSVGVRIKKISVRRATTTSFGARVAIKENSTKAKLVVTKGKTKANKGQQQQPRKKKAATVDAQTGTEDGAPPPPEINWVPASTVHIKEEEDMMGSC